MATYLFMRDWNALSESAASGITRADDVKQMTPKRKRPKRATRGDWHRRKAEQYRPRQERERLV